MAASQRVQPPPTAPVVSVDAGETEQEAQGEQAVGERRGHAVAVDVEDQAEPGDVGLDRDGVAARAAAADGAGGEGGAGEAEEEAKDEEPVGEGLRSRPLPSMSSAREAAKRWAKTP